MSEVSINAGGLQAADKMWLATFAAWITFEFLSDDLLSDSAARLVDRHPILGRVAILTFVTTLGGHLALVMPCRIDVFSAKNIFHQGIAHSYRRIEAKCLGR